MPINPALLQRLLAMQKMKQMQATGGTQMPQQPMPQLQRQPINPMVARAMMMRRGIR